MLPALTQSHQDFLEYFLACRGDVAAIARETGARSIDILAWMSQPAIAAYLRAARSARINHQRDDALAQLHAITTSHPDPTERRRAATTLLRATEPARWRLARKKAAARLTEGAGAGSTDATPAAQHVAQPSSPATEVAPSPAQVSPPSTHDSTPSAAAQTTPPATSFDPSHAEDLAETRADDSALDHCGDVDEDDLDEDHFDEDDLDEDDLDDDDADWSDDEPDDDDIDEHELNEDDSNVDVQEEIFDEESIPQVGPTPGAHIIHRDANAPAGPDNPDLPDHIPRS